MDTPKKNKPKLVISKTPLRITFVGGGTDIPAYYRNYGSGVSIAASINKYVYIWVHKRFDDDIRIAYTKTEMVKSVEEIEHPTVREALKLLKITGGIEIASMADIPSGTGLGSSSAFLVGVLNSLHTFKGDKFDSLQIAKEAVKIEREILKEPGGKQDQYIAALGGFQFMEFKKDETVENTEIKFNVITRNKIHDHLLLFYTGTQKPNTNVHTKMANSVDKNLIAYNKMTELGYALFKEFKSNKINNIGTYLNQNWLLKKKTHGLHNTKIDDYYKRAKEAGAIGGKILGAGDRGFLLLFAPPEKHSSIIKALSELKYEPFGFSSEGTKIIYKEE